MEPFSKLTEQGKIRRLRRLAWRALEAYDFNVTELRLLGRFTNTLFLLRIANGIKYILRVCTPGWRTETDLRSEILWLRALSQLSDIEAPIPIPARNGEFFIEAYDRGVPEPRRCMIMSWVPGIPLGKRLNEANLYQMGVLFARLHEQAMEFADYPKDDHEPESKSTGLLLPGFTRLKMDCVFARGEEDVMFSDSCMDMYSPHSREVILKVKEKVEEAFQKLYADPTGLRVIHNDLWHGNIKVYRGRLHPLDFEDTIWGYPVQDLAMAIQDLMVDTSAVQFESLQTALRLGYESRLPWPESYPDQIDIFRAGRMLWVANYVARFERKYLVKHIQHLTAQLERFLELGIIRKQEERDE